MKESMMTYHKIQTVFKRDPETKHKTLLVGEYSLPEFEYLKDNLWVFTEKVDGTNIRIIIKDGSITFGGRTDNAQIPATLVQRLNECFLTTQQKSLLLETFEDAVLYGEGYGAKIQKGGGNYRADQDFVLFDVQVGNFWLRRDDVEDVAQKFGLDVVPIIGTGTLDDMIKRVRDEPLKSLWGDFEAEGIVARPACELKTRNGDRLITKLKVRDFRATK